MAERSGRDGLSVVVGYRSDVDAAEDGMLAPVAREDLDALTSRTPLRRLGQPDAADLVAFLPGEEARWITGQTVHANGGVE